MLNPVTRTIELKDFRVEREKFKLNSNREQNVKSDLKTQEALERLTHLIQKKESPHKKIESETDPLLKLTSRTKNLIDSGCFMPAYKHDSDRTEREDLPNSKSSVFFHTHRKISRTNSLTLKIHGLRKIDRKLSEHEKDIIEKLAGFKQ